MKKTVIFLLALLTLSATLTPLRASAALRDIALELAELDIAARSYAATKTHVEAGDAQSAYEPGTSAAASILYDAEGGAALFEHNADACMLIASTTKIMTALIVLENRELDEVVDIKAEYTGIEGSSMYLKAGEKLTVRELLYGLMLASGNDSAVALAASTAGSVKKFADMMNERASQLGCVNSSFKNPHGLDAEGHYSTARDLARITAAAMKIPAFRDIASTKNVSIAGRALQNHNKLLWSYDGMVGGKTGYTQSAGRSLVTCVERNGMQLVCVTLSDPNDWVDHTSLYDWAFGRFQCVSLSKNDVKYLSIPVISGIKELVSAKPSIDFSYIAPKSSEITTTVEAPRFVYAGVIRGARAGSIIVRENGKTVAEVPLVYSESVKLDGAVPLTRWEQFKRTWFLANERGLPYSPAPVY